MRIAQIAPLAESVPPKLYGGTERVVSWLTEELVSLGHDVTLFATGDSVSSAQLVPVAPRALRLSRPPPDPAIATAALLEAVADAAPRFDVIHSHLDWVHLPLLRCLRVPFLTTLHGRLDLPNIELMGQRFPNAPFVSISQSQRTPAPDMNWLATIHHGLPLALLPFTDRQEIIWHFWDASTPRKVPTSPFGSHMQPVFRCASPPRSHADKPAISKRQLNLSSKETARISWAKSTIEKSKDFSAKRWHCCFPSTGPSRSVL